MRELGAAGNRGRRVLRMAQLADMHGFDFVFGPAEEPRPGRIDGKEITLEIRHREQIFRHVPDAIALERAAFDFLLEPFAEHAQFGLDAQARLFGAHTLDGEAELPRQRQRELHCLAVERPRRVVIDHEPADEPALGHQRDESERADAFLLDDGLERRLELGAIDVGHADRLGIGVVERPGRMAGRWRAGSLPTSRARRRNASRRRCRSAGSRRGCNASRP